MAERAGAAGLQSLEWGLQSEPEGLCLSLGWAASSTACAGCAWLVHAPGRARWLVWGVWEGESPGLAVCYSQAELIDIFPL